MNALNLLYFLLRAAAVAVEGFVSAAGFPAGAVEGFILAVAYLTRMSGRTR